MKIIVDAMGGDNAPKAPVLGALQANEKYGVDIILVGRGEDILKVLQESGRQELPKGVEIAHASEVVEICDDPANAFRRKRTPPSPSASTSSGTARETALSARVPQALCCRRPPSSPSASKASAGRRWPPWSPPETAARC